MKAVAQRGLYRVGPLDIKSYADLIANEAPKRISHSRAFECRFLTNF